MVLKVEYKDTDPSFRIPIGIIAGVGLRTGIGALQELASMGFRELLEPLNDFSNAGAKEWVLNMAKDTVTKLVEQGLYAVMFVKCQRGPSAVNIDDQALRQALLEAFRSSIAVSAFVNERAGDVVLGALSFGLSWASIYCGAGGALWSMANYRAGTAPIASPHTETAYVYVYPQTRAIIDAFSGQHLHHCITAEALRIIDHAKTVLHKFRLYDEALRSLETASNFTLKMLTYLDTILRECLMRLAEDVRALMYVLLRRISDVMNNVRVAYNDWNTIVQGKRLLTDQECLMVLKSALNELQAIEQEIEQIIEDIRAVAQQIPTSLSDIQQTLASIVDTLETKFGEFVDNILFPEFEKYAENLYSIRQAYTPASNVGWMMSDPVTGRTAFKVVV